MYLLVHFPQFLKFSLEFLRLHYGVFIEMGSIEKCDLCGKEIGAEKAIRAGRGHHFSGYVFCEKCGKPIKTFLDIAEKKMQAAKKK